MSMTQTQQHNVPTLRFPEFSGEWGIKRLEDVADFQNGKAHEQSISSDGDFVVVNSKFISTEGRIRKFTDIQISPLFVNDIVMVMSDIPKGKALAKCYLIDEDDLYSLNQRICSLRARNADPFYLFLVTNRNDYFLKFDSGVTQTNLRKDEVLRCPAHYPALPEQQKIASFLSLVDCKIAQLGQKKALLQQYKKGMMQKLFSQELRFKDAQGNDFPDWEEKRVGDVCEVNPKASALPEEFIYIDLESVVSGSLIKESRIQKTGAPSRAQRLLTTGDVLFQTVRPYQMNNYYFDKVGDYVASTGYAQLRAKGSAQFLYQILHTNSFVNKVLARCTGTSYPAINSNDLAKIHFAIPILPEQQKIADFLTSIDQKIDLVSTELYQANAFKKGLLQQMFI